jgi:hypothetical protein
LTADQLGRQPSRSRQKLSGDQLVRDARPFTPTSRLNANLGDLSKLNLDQPLLELAESVCERRDG